MTTDDQSTVPDAEAHRRVLYSVLLPAVSLAKRFRVPMKEILSLVEMAYFRELRTHGLTLDEAGDLLAISKRSTARLSKRLKSNFFRPEREAELPRRIDFMLWAEPMSLARLCRELDGFPPEEVEDALQHLLAENRVEEHPGRVVTYAVTRNADSLIRDRWTARIGALNTMTRLVGRVVHGRFFEGAETAFARTLSFRIRKQDLPKLQAIYSEGVWERLKALEEDAGPDDETISMNLSMMWAEYDEPQDK